MCSERLPGAQQLNIAVTPSHHAPLEPPPDVAASETTRSQRPAPRAHSLSTLKGVRLGCVAIKIVFSAVVLVFFFFALRSGLFFDFLQMKPAGRGRGH